jgi:hypothetical protein
MLEQQRKKIDMKWIFSQQNSADWLTKALPLVTYSELKYSIGMRSPSKKNQEDVALNIKVRSNNKFQNFKFKN